MADPTVSETKTEPLAAPLRRSRGRRRGRLIVALVVVIALAVGGYELMKYFGTYESTDDAQIDGHVDAISARISGQLNEVLVEDAQVVKAGETLVRIDPRDYQVAVAKAEADLADAEAALDGSRTDVPIVTTTTASTLDTARSSRADADAGLSGTQRQLAAAQARLETAQAQVVEAQAIYKKDTDDVERYRQPRRQRVTRSPRQQYDTIKGTDRGCRQGYH